MADQQHGTQNIEKVIDATTVFLKSVVDSQKDGFQANDAFEIFKAILAPAMQDAIGGIKVAKKEAGDLDSQERRKLTHKGIDFVYDVYDIFTEQDEVISIDPSTSSAT